MVERELRIIPLNRPFELNVLEFIFEFTSIENDYFTHPKIRLKDNERSGSMPKDSQPDNKKARMEKCNYQTPLTEENHQKNKNAKRQSIKNNDV